VVVGRPIQVEKIPEPTSEQVCTYVDPIISIPKLL